MISPIIMLLTEELDSDYKPALDFARFQQLLARAEEEVEREKLSTRERGRSQHMTDRMMEELAAKLVVKQDPGEKHDNHILKYFKFW